VARCGSVRDQLLGKKSSGEVTDVVTCGELLDDSLVS